MVKNTTGGTGTKSIARKHQTTDGDGGRLRLPTCELEQFALVTKMLGNGMCEIYTNNNQRMIGHIRNKFRGKQKRHNMITTQMVVLVGLREWENPIKNCDILTMYDSSQVDQLRNIPSVNIGKILELQLGSTHSASKNENELMFSNDDSTSDVAIPTATQEDFDIGTIEEVDIEDI
jgi:initiation factor 1A